ncbi:MAG: hypothetical protein F6J93_17815 [Oscillatoria sp. SIO1A7]|nr:hypothetical protein [Oscillatoria sp. SIO1A7]
MQPTSPIIGLGDKGTRGQGDKGTWGHGDRETWVDFLYYLLLTFPQCPMPNAQCPMPHAQFPMPNSPCPMPNFGV